MKDNYQEEKENNNNNNTNKNKLFSQKKENLFSE